MIELKNFTKGIEDKTLLENVNYSFPKTGIIIFKGENGCGKSTLLKVLALLDTDYKGQILWEKKI